MYRTYRVALGAVMALALIGLSTAARAVPVQFTYSGSVTAVSGAGLSGLVSVGNAFTIDVVLDNGSASLNSQTWAVLDTASATVTAGGYSANFTDDWFTSSLATGFTTDAAGNLLTAAWFGTDQSATATDNFGAGGSLELFNGFFLASNGNSMTYTPALSEESAWSGPRLVTDPTGPNDLAAPGALAVFGLGLAGLAALRRRAGSSGAVGAGRR